MGYPGETNSDFEETIDLIKNVEFASSYSFKYSQDQELQHHLWKPNRGGFIEKKTKKDSKLLLDQQKSFQFVLFR